MKSELRSKLQDILNSSFTSTKIQKKSPNNYFTQHSPYPSRYEDNSKISHQTNYKGLDFSIDGYKSKTKKRANSNHFNTLSSTKDYLNKSFGELSVLNNKNSNNVKDFFGELSLKFAQTRNKRNNDYSYDFEQLKKRNKSNTNLTNNNTNNLQCTNIKNINGDDSRYKINTKKNNQSSLLSPNLKKQMDIFTESLFKKKTKSSTPFGKDAYSRPTHSKYGSFLTRNYDTQDKSSWGGWMVRENKDNVLTLTSEGLVNPSKKYKFFNNKKIENFMREFDIDNNSLKKIGKRKSNDYKQLNF